MKPHSHDRRTREHFSGCLLGGAVGDALDSTGAITGNLLGLMLGRDAIPARWLDGLELRAEIEAVASDLNRGFEESHAWWTRYPGW